MSAALDFAAYGASAPRGALLPALNQALGLPVAELSADSRRVRPGVTFAAFPGERADGRAYIEQALQAGADAVLWEAKDFVWRTEWQRPNVGVLDLRSWVGPLAAELHAHPSRQMLMFGVTGTNGKTSCSHWLAQCLNAAGKKCGVIGTLGNGFLAEAVARGQLQASANTTPDPIALQAALARMRAAGAHAVSMEVSSHGLAQGRINGTHIDVALFTNLSRDHLDYHGNMQRYFEAKARLFEWADLRAAVINLDDTYGQELARRCIARGLPVYGYGWHGAYDHLGGQLAWAHGEALQATSEGVSFAVRYEGAIAQVRAGVLGAFNAHNLLGVIGALIAAGVSLEQAARLASQVQPVLGRMQRVSAANAPVAVIDYAHTPDALEKVLQALRASLYPGARLFVVFGCGGDRDRGKRALMGAVAARLADHVIVTSDNPRSEAPQAIVDDILQGIQPASGARTVEADRAKAIALAIADATVHDIVLIAGKGHEDYQEIAGKREPFSDVEHARAALAIWQAPGAGA